MDRGTWWAMVHRVTKSRTPLKWLNMNCMKRRLGDTHTHTRTHAHTDRRPREGFGRRWPPRSQGERPQKKPTLLTP